MPNPLKQAVDEALDKGRPDDGRETIDNRERGCGHLKPNSAYLRSDVAALSGKGGTIPRFVELDEPIEYRESAGRGAIIPGYAPFPGNSFSLHYAAEGYTTTPAGDIHDHIDRLGRFGFDGDHYGDITSASSIDLLMSVGKSNWETPDDFVAETRERGLNLKIPVSSSQEPPTVEPLRTRVWVVHPHGAGEDRPAIIGYSYLTRCVFTTGTKASADDPDVPKWAEDFASTGRMDIVDRGEPIAEDDDAYDEAQTSIDDHLSPKEGVAEARKALGTDSPGGTVTVEDDGATAAPNEGTTANPNRTVTAESPPFPPEDDEGGSALEAFADSIAEDAGTPVDDDPLTSEERADQLAEEGKFDVDHRPERQSVAPDDTDDDDDDRDVATLTVADGDAPGDVTGIEVEFGRHDVSNTRRRDSFDAAYDEGPLNYNALKSIAGNREDVDVGMTPSKDDLIDAIVVGAGGFVPAYDGGGADE